MVCRIELLLAREKGLRVVYVVFPVNKNARVPELAGTSLQAEQNALSRSAPADFLQCRGANIKEKVLDFGWNCCAVEGRPASSTCRGRSRYRIASSLLFTSHLAFLRQASWVQENAGLTIWQDICSQKRTRPAQKSTEQRTEKVYASKNLRLPTQKMPEKNVASCLSSVAPTAARSTDRRSWQHSWLQSWLQS